jgi:hypothetical protein
MVKFLLGFGFARGRYPALDRYTREERVKPCHPGERANPMITGGCRKKVERMCEIGVKKGWRI